MHRRGRQRRLMVLFLTICFPAIQAMNDIIVEKPFYLRARIHDSQTASVQFEIAQVHTQRACQMYRFTIRRNQDHPYSMPEQNLTFWRNSLELKHLAMGDYRICAIICSEHLNHPPSPYDILKKKNLTVPIYTCVNIHAYRSHLLVLTLYILVFLILAVAQTIFTLRKRKIRAGIKAAVFEVENILQKWRTAQTTDEPHTYNILQTIVSVPAAPIDHAVTAPCHPALDEHRSSHPILFHLEIPDEQSVTEIP